MIKYRRANAKDGLFIYNLLKENMHSYFQDFLPEGWDDNKFWEGFNPEMGARPLRRVIQRKIEDRPDR